MPKRLMKRAWGQGVQRPSQLAKRFEVSPRAIDVRLAQLGLVEPRDRCATPSTVQTPGRPRHSYYRQSSPAWLLEGATA